MLLLSDDGKLSAAHNTPPHIIVQEFQVPTFSNANSNNLIGPLHHLLVSDNIQRDDAGTRFGEILTDFLEAQPEFQEEAIEYFRKNPLTNLSEARKLKKKCS